MITIDIRDQMAHNILSVRLLPTWRDGKEYHDYFDMHIVLENHSGVPGEEIVIRHLSMESLMEISDTIRKVLKV